MSEPEQPAGTPRPRRRRDLDEIFGDVLPATTSDEREPEGPETERDGWYERNRPPHHDRD
jgi:hypothetical protein